MTTTTRVAAIAIVADMPTFADVTAEEWRRLAGRTLFFAHQSVGANVLEGVAELLREHPEIPLRVVDVDDPTRVDGPALYHRRVGQNGKPSTKIAEFASMTATILRGARDGVALMKFCYVDVKGRTDPDALFAEYERAVADIRRAQPDVVLVHVTMPLWKDTGFIDHWGTVALGKATPIRALNAARHRFNESMREAYRDREPVFDLAALETVRADGSEATVRHGGGRVPSLALEWTSDGGHLNEAGRRHIAGRFLATLAKLPVHAAVAPSFAHHHTE